MPEKQLMWMCVNPTLKAVSRLVHAVSGACTHVPPGTPRLTADDLQGVVRSERFLYAFICNSISL